MCIDHEFEHWFGINVRLVRMLKSQYWSLLILFTNSLFLLFMGQLDFKNLNDLRIDIYNKFNSNELVIFYCIYMISCFGFSSCINWFFSFQPLIMVHYYNLISYMLKPRRFLFCVMSALMSVLVASLYCYVISGRYTPFTTDCPADITDKTKIICINGFFPYFALFSICNGIWNTIMFFAYDCQMAKFTVKTNMYNKLSVLISDSYVSVIYNFLRDSFTFYFLYSYFLSQFLTSIVYNVVYYVSGKLVVENQPISYFYDVRMQYQLFILCILLRFSLWLPFNCYKIFITENCEFSIDNQENYSGKLDYALLKKDNKMIYYLANQDLYTLMNNDESRINKIISGKLSSKRKDFVKNIDFYSWYSMSIVSNFTKELEEFCDSMSTISSIDESHRQKVGDNFNEFTQSCVDLSRLQHHAVPRSAVSLSDVDANLTTNQRVSSAYPILLAKHRNNEPIVLPASERGRDSICPNLLTNNRKTSRLSDSQRRFANESTHLFRPDYYSHQYTIPKFPAPTGIDFIFTQIKNALWRILDPRPANRFYSNQNININNNNGNNDFIEDFYYTNTCNFNTNTSNNNTYYNINDIVEHDYLYNPNIFNDNTNYNANNTNNNNMIRKHYSSYNTNSNNLFNISNDDIDNLNTNNTNNNTGYYHPNNNSNSITTNPTCNTTYNSNNNNNANGCQYNTNFGQCNTNNTTKTIDTSTFDNSKMNPNKTYTNMFLKGLPLSRRKDFTLNSKGYLCKVDQVNTPIETHQSSSFFKNDLDIEKTPANQKYISPQNYAQGSNNLTHRKIPGISYPGNENNNNHNNGNNNGNVAKKNPRNIKTMLDSSLSSMSMVMQRLIDQESNIVFESEDIPYYLQCHSGSSCWSIFISKLRYLLYIKHHVPKPKKVFLEYQIVLWNIEATTSLLLYIAQKPENSLDLQDITTKMIICLLNCYCVLEHYSEIYNKTEQKKHYIGEFYKQTPFLLQSKLKSCLYRLSKHVNVKLANLNSVQNQKWIQFITYTI